MAHACGGCQRHRQDRRRRRSRRCTARRRVEGRLRKRGGETAGDRARAHGRQEPAVEAGAAVEGELGQQRQA